MTTMSEFTYFAILPRPTVDSEEFWAGCNRGQLLLSKCGACGHRFYYPRRLCPACGSNDLGWEESAGRGTVFSHSDVHVSFYGPSWESQLPYTVVLVDLDEGPRMLSRMAKSDAPPVRTGDRVQVSFIEVDGQKLPFFERA
ncbi:Zn-ribbon domain-containing OB-fold protein [Rhodoligotrophos ferricapiens]|uniref:Zn-ribbon domain-containing OB-fold protein n=1 Tax=Rhodoligotrophos ferricapiens TaxID=3069264 RepID=UPI00315D103F